MRDCFFFWGVYGNNIKSRKCSDLGNTCIITHTDIRNCIINSQQNGASTSFSCCNETILTQF